MPQGLKDFIKKLFPHAIRRRLLPIYHGMRAVGANIRYGFPSHGMTVVGVTGTNGKTTTANMIGKILTESGRKTGIFSTAVIQVGDDWQDSAMKLTTEDVFTLNKYLRDMKRAGVTHLVLEVSSHAISQHRIWGIHFSGAVFTNLSHDHLDYHRDMEEYGRTKAKLFKKAKDFIVVNMDDKWHTLFLTKPKSMTTTYGKKASAKLAITDVKLTDKGSTATLVSKDSEMKISVSLSGEFNLYNAAAATAASRWLGLSEEEIIKGLKALKFVPGRMEEINEGQPFKVLVDHGHTADSVKSLLKELKQLTKGRLLFLLGTDGGRDSFRREPLAKAVAKYSDYIVVADQEPYSDSPDQIRKDLIAGLKSVNFKDYEEIADRKKAIMRLFSKAKKDDIVVLAGMGNLKSRGMVDGPMKWDERQVARELLKTL